MTSRFFEYDPQGSGPQYLENIATAYWFSEVLFAALDLGLFTLLEGRGKTVEEISFELGFDASALQRLLRALGSMGLVIENGSRYFNAKISSDHLLKGNQDYQGDSILWRRDLVSHWAGLRDCLRAGGRTTSADGNEDEAKITERRNKYIRAMDNMAKTKVKEMLPFFQELPIEGEMLDVGAGSAAVAAGFLRTFPVLKATLIDIAEMLQHTRGFVRERHMEDRVAYLPVNILEPWPFAAERFDLVVLSNILHAYSEKELPHILSQASACLKSGGLIVIHDFFFEHFPAKAALFDLNMLINTFNGGVFAGETIIKELRRAGLSSTPLLPLATDTAVIAASKNPDVLGGLCIDKKSRLAPRLKALGFRNVFEVPVSTIHIAAWTEMKCRYGCGHFGSPNCPPKSPMPEKTKLVLQDYSSAFLLEGEPPTRQFQQNVLRAEKEAFTAGFYKAFSYWSGPCSLCDTCAKEGECRNTRDARPSMEAVGIDVFETVRRAGIPIRTLPGKDDFVKYFGLLLLE